MMQNIELIREIQRLPLSEQFYIVEIILKTIKNVRTTEPLEAAAEALYDDYFNDKELTPFTSLDLEDFYEAR